jgi:hypothetical protein
MNASFLRTVQVFASMLLVGTASVNAQIPTQSFKAGAYRGVMHVTTSVEGVGQTKASIKVRGRSTGSPTLQFIGTPQLAGEVLGVQDDFMFKVFRLQADFTQGGIMTLNEITNLDADGAIRGRRLNSLTVGNNMVKAGVDYEETLGVTTINFAIRVVLTRVGN